MTHRIRAKHVREGEMLEVAGSLVMVEKIAPFDHAPFCLRFYCTDGVVFEAMPDEIVNLVTKR